jgi:hypothetical protein
MLSILSLFRRSSNDSQIDSAEIGGVAAIAEALAGRGAEDYTPDIYFGEPRLVDRAFGPTSDLYVLIPTSTAEGERDPSNVEFELPDNPNDENEALNAFMEDIGVDTIDEVEGSSVNSVQTDGVLKPAYTVPVADEGDY